MKLLKLLILALITATLIFFLNRTLVINGNALPPFGKFLDPVNGFWANAEAEMPHLKKAVQSDALHGEVTIRYDERWVPHVFTVDAHDAYFAQGYVTASHRLWQMEFQTHAAAGRLSEILYHTAGEKVLKVDRLMRRNGLKRAAEASLAAFENDPQANMIVTAYTEGVNAYIESLNYRKYPVEYKLLGYKPEKWTKLKCALLLKYMAHMLTGESDDIELTHQVNKFGNDFVNLFYPDFPVDMTDPIVPSGTAFQKDPAFLPKADSSVTADSIPKVAVQKLPFEKIPEGYGSNNWAVAGSKTKSGAPILCNDPHLALNFPSIWFEMQISCPDFNVYGATLPGAPAVIVGFNDHISWGVTNGTRDVKDWYTLKFKDESRSEYWVDGQWEKVTVVKDTFYLRGESKPFIDEVIQTRFGTVIYDNGLTEDESAKNLACHWIATEPSNELFTFVKLNSATNYDEYAQALTYFNCPAQNFVFASKTGDVALWQQGGLYIHKPGQGKFVQDGTLSQNIWTEKIAPAYTPHVKNPERGFVSSANQHPTDSLYPYYYNGRFEYYRNRRINSELTRLSGVTPQDMMKLQNDNYNLIAAEALPYMLQNLRWDKAGSAAQYHDILSKWNYFNDADQAGPAVFQEWWDQLVSIMYEELAADGLDYQIPQQYNTIRVMKAQPGHFIFDYAPTEGKKENVSDLLEMSFRTTCKTLDSLQAGGLKLNWSDFKGTSVQHLLFTLKPFGRFNIHIGGGKNIVNACANRWGPSWRMIVSMEKDIRAYGVYPGGQSGNPGSRFYDNFIDKWAAGEYYELWFMKSADEEKQPVLFTQKLFK